MTTVDNINDDSGESDEDDILSTLKPWTQCSFKNTKGVQCYERYFGESTCCRDHQCTFINKKNEQCKQVINCNSRWYCKKHGNKCRCLYQDDDGKQCKKTIYFHI